MKYTQIENDKNEIIALRDDKTGNTATINRWGDAEKCEIALDQMAKRGCADCTDCSDCSRCASCVGSVDCASCVGCSRCVSCIDCVDSVDCASCTGCVDCVGCSRCVSCIDCVDCASCTDCVGCPEQTEKTSNALFAVPKIEKIHAQVLSAIKKDGCSLNMSEWHTCQTTHCRAGWVVFLAGDEGSKLEAATSTGFAAMQIYKASSPIKVSPTRFYDSNEKAMEDIVRCAELEASLTNETETNN